MWKRVIGSCSPSPCPKCLFSLSSNSLTAYLYCLLCGIMKFLSPPCPGLVITSVNAIPKVLTFLCSFVIIEPFCVAPYPAYWSGHGTWVVHLSIATLHQIELHFSSRQYNLFQAALWSLFFFGHKASCLRPVVMHSPVYAFMLLPLWHYRSLDWTPHHALVQESGITFDRAVWM